jgi:hypothetical protein
MQTHRAGTNRRIMERLAAHKEYTLRFMAEGFSREEASKRAMALMSENERTAANMRKVGR